MVFLPHTGTLRPRGGHFALCTLSVLPRKEILANMIQDKGWGTLMLKMYLPFIQNSHFTGQFDLLCLCYSLLNLQIFLLVFCLLNLAVSLETCLIPLPLETCLFPLHPVTTVLKNQNRWDRMAHAQCLCLSLRNLSHAGLEPWALL